MDERDRTDNEIRIERDDADEPAPGPAPENQGDVLGISHVRPGRTDIPAPEGPDAERIRDEESAPDLSETIEEHHGLGSRDVTQDTVEERYRQDRRR